MSNFEIDISPAILLVYSTSGITSGKKFVATWKGRPKFAPKVFFDGDDVIDVVTGWPQNLPPYSCLVEFGSGSKLEGQCLANKCKYRNRLSMLYTCHIHRPQRVYKRFSCRRFHHFGVIISTCRCQKPFYINQPNKFCFKGYILYC